MLFEVIGDGVLDGGCVVLIVVVMFVMYVGFLVLVNYVLNGVIGLMV